MFEVEKYEVSGPTQGAVEVAGRRWHGRPVAAASVRLGAVSAPFIIAWLAVYLLSGFFYRPGGLSGLGLWFVQALGVSLLVSFVMEQLTRRVIPLAALLNMTLVFPDHAPSRFSVALRSGTVGRLQERVDAATAEGLGATDQEAAQRAVELIAVLSRHDRLTRGHTERVRAYADLMAEELGLDRAARDKLAWGAMLHDVGKLAVPSEILNKEGRPTDDEWEILQGHPAAGADLLEPLQGWLGQWVLAAAQHHERWDGGGYPAGLVGEEISLAGRITAVADAYDVITSRRSYKPPMSVEAARHEIIRCAGSQFDPDVVRAFLNVSLGRRWLTGPLASALELPGVANLGSNLPAVTNIVAGAIVAAGSVIVPAVAGWIPPDGIAFSDDVTVVAGAPPSETTVDHATDLPPSPDDEQIIAEDTPTTGQSADDEETGTSSPEGGGTAAPEPVPTVPPSLVSTTSSQSVSSSSTGISTAAPLDPGPSTFPISPTTVTSTSQPATSQSTAGQPTTVTQATTTTAAAPTTTAPTTTTTTAPTMTTAPEGSPDAVPDSVSVNDDKDIKIKVLDNDDPGGSPFDEASLVIIEDPQHAASFRVHGDHLHYKSVRNYDGLDTIQYEICNTDGLCATGIVTITVNG